MNVCYLIKLHVNILTFKRLLTKEHMLMLKVRIFFLHLICGNNHNGVILILCMVPVHLLL